MPRKTKEQKIIADLRRQLQASRPVTVKPTVRDVRREETTLPQIAIAPIGTITADYSYLKWDLLKVGTLVVLLAAFEIATSVLASSGGLKSFGL